MPLDQYSPCPCGSGKKMKFCKCVEQPQDYEKLVRLIEGGQELAAMDRINQMLAKTPNAAWLLALKGELALSMQEIDTFKETAHRFLKLKPDNPLALIMKSLASSLDSEPVENAANYLLGGLAESRESLPAMTLLAIDLLVRSLAASGKLSLAGYWGDLRNILNGNQQNAGDSVLQDESLNLIVKVPARVVDDPAGAAWKERLAEALSLSRVFCFAQAETKLRAILRDFPDQPGPLSNLLRAQMAQLNQSGAHATARKLAEHLEVPSEDRAYFSALALELESEHSSLRPLSIARYGEIDSLDRVVGALAALDFVQEVSDESAEQLKQIYASTVEDEVPAKHVYTVFDRPLKLAPGDDQAAESSQADALKPQIANWVATIVLFGKQTDKAARGMFLATRFAPYQKRIEEVLELLSLGEDIRDVSQPVRQTYVDFLSRPKAIIGPREAPTIEERGQQVLEEFLNLPFPLFDGATPLEAASEERFRGALLGLLCHLEGEQSLLLPQSTIGEIYQRLGLERPRAKLSLTAEKINISNILDMDRVDLSQLSDQHLQGMMLRAMNLAASRVLHHCAVEALNRESLADHAQTQILAHSALRQTAETLDKKIEHSQQLYARLSAAKASVGRLAIELVSLLAAARRDKEAQQFIMEAITQHPDDPYLMSFMQQIMQGQRGPGVGSDALASRMLQQQATRSEAGAGLVLPGQAAAAPQGESKLWLPGS